LQQRPYRSRCEEQVGQPPAFLDALGARSAHVDRPAAQRFREHKTKTVNVGFRGEFASSQSHLLGRRVALTRVHAIVVLLGACEAEIDQLRLV
jgi:hypothetical protein